MVTKYKCIKKYPGHSLGEIHIYDGDNYGTHIIGTNKWYGTKFYESYPEFWEKVVEKDYKILSFKQNSYINDLWINFSDNDEPGCWCRSVKGKSVTSGYTTKDILNNKFYSIYSIKRLSDGEVFTIGDKTNGGTIKTFLLYSVTINNVCTEKNKLGIVYNHDLKNSSYPNLKDIQHVKKPLFTTEDGVELFEGDKYYNVFFEYSSNKRIIPFTVNGPNDVFKEGDSVTYSKKSKYFSTKEAAEKYIEENKPQYSKEDMLDFGKKCFLSRKTVIKLTIIEIINKLLSEWNKK